MPFRPKINSKIKISQRAYTFTEHPAAKGMPYGQTGRRATVYQLQDNAGTNHALKVFTRAFRSPRYEETANKLAKFSQLSGLQACSRQVFTAQNQASLLSKYPDLQYSLLMPWVEGQTWQEILLSSQPVSKNHSLKIASAFISLLQEMENRQIAHCDLAGPNLLIHTQNGSTNLALVDVEDLYAPTLLKPEKLPAGSAGYAHKEASKGLWQVEADRFAGAILLAEMLGWSNPSVRRIAVGEQYFDPSEIHQPTDRYNILKSALKKDWGMGVADLFTAAWFSETLKACPPLSDWRDALDIELAPVKKAFFSSPAAPQPLSTPPAEIQLNDAGSYLYDSFKTQLEEQNFVEAEKLVNALQALIPTFDTPQAELTEARQNASQAEAKQKHEKRISKLEEKQQDLIKSIQKEEEELSQERQALEEKQKDLEQREESLGKEKEKLQKLNQQITDLHTQINTSNLGLEIENLEAAPPTRQIATKEPHSLPTRKKWKPLSWVSEFKHESGGLFANSHYQVEDVKFINHPTHFITIDDASEARIWNFAGEIVKEWVCSAGKPTFMSYDWKNERVAIGDDLGEVRIYNISSQVSKRFEFSLAHEISSLGFAPSGDVLAIGNTQELNLIALQDKSNKFENFSNKKIRDGEIESIAYSPDGSMFAIAFEDGLIELVGKGTLLAKTKVSNGPSMVFDSNSNFLFISDLTGKITVLTVPDFSQAISFSTVAISEMCSIAISPDNEILATGTEEGQIYLWSTGDGKLLEKINTHSDAVYGLDFHPNGKHLISASYDGRAILWEIE
jgi:serine/threonine protein kinase